MIVTAPATKPALQCSTVVCFLCDANNPIANCFCFGGRLVCSDECFPATAVVVHVSTWLIDGLLGAVPVRVTIRWSARQRATACQ